MQAAVETHWDIKVWQDEHRTYWQCGCGARGSCLGVAAKHVAIARRMWTDHDCVGRPLMRHVDLVNGGGTDEHGGRGNR